MESLPLHRLAGQFKLSEPPCLELDSQTDRYLIVINCSDSPAQGRVQAVGSEIRGKIWRLLDQFSSESYERDGDEMLDPGLYVDLLPWGYHFFRFENL